MVMKCTGPHWCLDYQASYCRESCTRCMMPNPAIPCIDGVLQKDIMEIDLEDARTIAMALISHNQKLIAEFEKIAFAGENVSEFIKEAAVNSYNEMTKAGTELHTRLAQAFPELAVR